MKLKSIVIATVLAINTLAMANQPQGEVRLGVGYEPYRFTTNYKFKDMQKIQDGFVVNAEWLPYRSDNGRVQFGVGVEHSFGRKTLNILGYDNTGKTPKTYEIGSTTPVYLAAKVNLVKAKDLKRDTEYDPLYLAGRLGYSFNVGKDAKPDADKIVNSTFKSGPYAAIGLGTEYKYMFAEAMYGVNYIPSETAKFTDGTLTHKVGITLGVKLDYKYKDSYKDTNVMDTFKEEVKTPEPEPVTPVQQPIVEEQEVSGLDGFDTEDKTPEKVVEKAPEHDIQTVKDTKTVYFNFDKSTLTKDQLEQVKEARDILNKFNYVDVNISGHTDSKGSKKYNQRLGQKRAEYVVKELKKLGLNDTVNIKEVKSFGETQLKSKTNPKENRRVEIDFSGWWDAAEEINQ